MPWLRIDDGFPQHPKIIQLRRPDRWTWLEVLAYCARYRTDGVVPDSIREVVRDATPGFLDRCYELGLLDLHSDLDTYVVHDWRDFNPKDPTAAQRKSRQRSRQSHGDVTDTGVTETVTGRDSRVGARARPVPSPSPTPEASVVNGPVAAEQHLDFENVLKAVEQ